MEWLSTKDRLPDDNSMVLLIVKFVNKDSGHIRNERFVGWYDIYSQKWRTNYFYGYKEFAETEKELSDSHKVEITHWMPLPELPKGE